MATCRYAEVLSLTNNGSIVVIPAFETADMDRAYEVAKGGKQVRILHVSSVSKFSLL